MFPDNIITVVAGEEKPLKCIYEGDSTLIMGDPLRNQDLTQEYLYGERYGMGILLAGDSAGIGRYTLPN